jgi:hypothetical protein
VSDARAEADRDQEFAEAIIRELRPGRGPALSTIAYVVSHIERVRAAARKADARPRPSDAREQIDRVVSHAWALAKSVDRLHDQWRDYLVLAVFQERHPDGAVKIGRYCRPAPAKLVGRLVEFLKERGMKDADIDEACELLATYPDYSAEANEKMREWLADLKKIPRHFGNASGDLFHKPTKLCAFVSHEMILELSPAFKFQRGQKSKFSAITRLLWQAATGEPEGKGGAGLTRVCDELVDLYRKIEIEAQKPVRGIAAQR